MEMNEKLKEYIDKNIFPEYEKNESAHDINHIKYVIDRSMKFAEEVHGINIDMAYTIAAYHDIGHHINTKNHEKVSENHIIGSHCYHSCRNIRIPLSEIQA